jgi:hypothetical protein
MHPLDLNPHLPPKLPSLEVVAVKPAANPGVGTVQTIPCTPRSTCHPIALREAATMRNLVCLNALRRDEDLASVFFVGSEVLNRCNCPASFGKVTILMASTTADVSYLIAFLSPASGRISRRILQRNFGRRRRRRDDDDESSVSQTSSLDDPYLSPGKETIIRLS